MIGRMRARPPRHLGDREPWDPGVNCQCILNHGQENKLKNMRDDFLNKTVYLTLDATINANAKIIPKADQSTSAV